MMVTTTASATGT